MLFRILLLAASVLATGMANYNIAHMDDMMPSEDSSPGTKDGNMAHREEIEELPPASVKPRDIGIPAPVCNRNSARDELDAYDPAPTAFPTAPETISTAAASTSFSAGPGIQVDTHSAPLLPTSSDTTSPTPPNTGPAPTYSTSVAASNGTSSNETHSSVAPSSTGGAECSVARFGVMQITAFSFVQAINWLFL
ncbi:hypothetical protein CC78DRAFT_546270 [Lojkania enalia]|uniref:Uncharacterized protein n=1 Tax=Lojkania enalia TaxID=147567 RepID=A0A9P4MXX2_9PLEO|nr:hypothetical protein CC78DRAFT_546270 [Didymosphaeria enalia]